MRKGWNEVNFLDCIFTNKIPLDFKSWIIFKKSGGSGASPTVIFGILQRKSSNEGAVKHLRISGGLIETSSLNTIISRPFY
ncbi:MAG: hypothetical protein WBE34_07990 [Candidatus Nitrosopolaris sp.]